MKAKINQFRVSIRRQQKDKIFGEMRKQHQQMSEIDELLERILKLEMKRQNFEILCEHLQEINKFLIEFSKNGSKGSILDVGKLLSEEMNIPFNPFEGLSKKYTKFVSQRFKRKMIQLFEQVHKVKKTKINNKWLQISEKLLSELAFMTGILFKEPESLLMIFPFNSIKEYTVNHEYYPHQNTNDYEDIFQFSFQLFEWNITCLKQQFQNLDNQSDSNLINFFTTIYSISTTLQFFVLNNQRTSKITMINESSADNQKVIYLFSILRSHNIQNYLMQILEEISNNHNKGQIYNSFDEVPMILSLLSLINRYCEFVQFGGFFIQTESFQLKVNIFYSFSLKWFSSRNNCQTEQQIEQKSSQHKDSGLRKIHRLTNSTDLRLLFELHSLSCQSILSLNEKDLVALCYEMIDYLLICAQNIQNQNQYYEQQVQTQSRTLLLDFYFNVLVAEKGERWINFLQILTSLQSLVKKNEISLDKIMSYAFEKDRQFSQRIVLKLFGDMNYCITNISGYFYNERHFFLQSLVNLFVIWSNNSFQKGISMWDCDFWMNISYHLYKLIDEIQFSIKGNGTVDIDSYNQTQQNSQVDYFEVQLEQNRTSKIRCPAVILVDELKKIVDQTVKQIRDQSFDPSQQIDI